MDVLGSLSPNNTMHNRDKRSSSISSISPGFVISPAPDGNTTSPALSDQQNTTTSPTKVCVNGSSGGGENQTENATTSHHVPKFASSPKPNNSFMFARGPPDGAEKVPLNVEEIR